MPYAYVTTAATYALHTGAVYKVKVTVNKATTGAIKIIDNTTGTTANVATIAASTAAGVFEYWDLQSGLIVINASTEDITVNWDSSNKAR